jgi:hypothetical protein
MSGVAMRFEVCARVGHSALLPVLMALSVGMAINKRIGLNGLQPPPGAGRVNQASVRERGGSIKPPSGSGAGQ